MLFYYFKFFLLMKLFDIFHIIQVFLKLPNIDGNLIENISKNGCSLRIILINSNFINLTPIEHNLVPLILFYQFSVFLLKLFHFQIFVPGRYIQFILWCQYVLLWIFTIHRGLCILIQGLDVINASFVFAEALAH